MFRSSPELRALAARVADELERFAPRFDALCLDLHRQPELGTHEVNTVTRLAGELEEEGFAVTTGVGGLPTAFRAERGRGGPRVAFLVEYDALPGMGHAGGHNLLCAASLGAAVALARAAAGVDGSVLVIGAPAEETIGGKIVLAGRGAYDDVDAALLAHPWSDDRAAVRSLASWSVEVVFEGRAAHAVVAPEQGINALDAAIQLFVARDALLKSLHPDVRIPGVLLEGGVRANMVPERARARFSLRAPDAAYLLQKVLPRFTDVVEGVARATGATASIRPIDNLYDELHANDVLSELYVEHARRAGLEPSRDAGRPIGSLDVGALSHRVPVLHALFSIADEPVGTHTHEFAAASVSARAIERTRRAALALAWTGLELLADPESLARARAFHEHTARPRGPRPEVPLITEQHEA